MRVFQTLEEAAREIRRDLYKSPKLNVSRVQQQTGLHIQARESLGYSYSILPDGWPADRHELVNLACDLDFGFWQEHKNRIIDWLYFEDNAREGLWRYSTIPTEGTHPALKTTIEGNWPSYTYQERLDGALGTLQEILRLAPDSRRAYWPIFQPIDSKRAMSPTRVPCSLGYEALIRPVGDQNHLLLYYLQRSADFDTFWLSDAWLAHRFQQKLYESLFREGTLEKLDLQPGLLAHTIISFHSFFAAGSEVY